MGWEPIDLRYLGERPPIKLALEGLGYHGRRHGWSGPPESAKTTVAYIVLLEEARRAQRVMVVDFEMGPYDARDRFRDLGATDDDLEHLLFVEPDTPAGERTVGELVDRWQPTIVLFDSAAGAFDIQGLDDNRRQDTERLARAMVDPLRDRGIASITLDHVTKNPDGRGKYAIGSERKLGGTDVSLGFETKVPFSRGKTGVITVTVHKDRFGHLPRPRLADIELASDPETHSIAWAWKKPQSDGETDTFQPTILMGRVSNYLATQPEPVSINTVEGAVRGKSRDWIRKAIEALIHGDYIAETKGARGARMLTLTRPYTTSPDLAGTSPGEDTRDLAYLAHPLQGGEVPGEVKRRSQNGTPPGEVDEELERLLTDHADIAGAASLPPSSLSLSETEEAKP